MTYERTIGDQRENDKVLGKHKAMTCWHFEWIEPYARYQAKLGNTQVQPVDDSWFLSSRCSDDDCFGRLQCLIAGDALCLFQSPSPPPHLRFYPSRGVSSMSPSNTLLCSCCVFHHLPSTITVAALTEFALRSMPTFVFRLIRVFHRKKYNYLESSDTKSSIYRSVD